MHAMTAKQWNAKHPSGTKVLVTRDSGEVIETRTRSLAWDFREGTPVVELEGFLRGGLRAHLRSTPRRSHLRRHSSVPLDGAWRPLELYQGRPGLLAPP